MVTRWSRSTSNFYTLIGQNLTGEFMRKNYAASWKLFTLTAEADRVLSHLVMFLTVFFLWMYKMKYSCYQESSVIHGWFVYWVFGWEMRGLSKFGNSISDSLPSDEIKLWLTPSAKQRRNPCSGLPAVYPDLSTGHDWPVKKGFVLFVVIANQVEGEFETHFR